MAHRATLFLSAQASYDFNSSGGEITVFSKSHNPYKFHKDGMEIGEQGQIQQRFEVRATVSAFRAFWHQLLLLNAWLAACLCLQQANQRTACPVCAAITASNKYNRCGTG